MSSCEPASEIVSGDWNDYITEIGMITKKQDSNRPNVINKDIVFEALHMELQEVMTLKLDARAKTPHEMKKLRLAIISPQS